MIYQPLGFYGVEDGESWESCAIFFSEFYEE
jgi:hypothetical protein